MVKDQAFDTLEQTYWRACVVIQAMHDKPWWRVGILNRRPWRNPRKFKEHGHSFVSRLWNYCMTVHDCADPAVGCSCFGSYRFPKIGAISAPNESK